MDSKMYRPWNRPPMLCNGGPKRGMYHSYISRNCFNFCHSTTLSRRKRVSKVTGNMTSNSGFVRSAEFLQYGIWTHQISKRGYPDRVISNCAWNLWQFWMCSSKPGNINGLNCFDGWMIILKVKVLKLVPTTNFLLVWKHWHFIWFLRGGGRGLGQP